MDGEKVSGVGDETSRVASATANALDATALNAIPTRRLVAASPGVIMEKEATNFSATDDDVIAR